MIAQAMRAILLATATATSLAGFLASSLMIQGCLCGCSRAWRTTSLHLEQSSEIAISLLGDAAKPFLATRRVLPRHKSDPCCKIPTGFEATRVCDSGSDGRGPDHAYPGYGFEAAAHIIGTVMCVNGAIQSPDLQFQSSELIDNSLQCLFHRRWKSFVITLVRDDRAKLREVLRVPSPQPGRTRQGGLGVR